MHWRPVVIVDAISKIPEMSLSFQFKMHQIGNNLISLREECLHQAETSQV